MKRLADIRYLINGMCCMLVFPILVFKQDKLKSHLLESGNFGASLVLRRVDFSVCFLFENSGFSYLPIR